MFNVFVIFFSRHMELAAIIMLLYERLAVLDSFHLLFRNYLKRMERRVQSPKSKDPDKVWWMLTASTPASGYRSLYSSFRLFMLLRKTIVLPPFVYRSLSTSSITPLQNAVPKPHFVKEHLVSVFPILICFEYYSGTASYRVIYLKLYQ